MKIEHAEEENDSSVELKFYQVVDDVEAVVLAVAGVDAAVSFLPHVILQRRFIPEGFLTVQTLQTDKRTRCVTRAGQCNRTASTYGHNGRGEESDEDADGGRKGK